MMATITPEVVGAAYLKTRGEIAELKKQMDELKALQEKREQWFAKQLSDSGTQSMKTSGDTPVTFFFSKKESVKVADRDSFFQWAFENEATEFFNSSVNKTAALECMGEDRNKPLPPGLEYTSIREVRVRKA